MRIAHVFHALDPSEGGTFRVMVNMAASTAALGHEVEVWTFRIPEPTPPDVESLAGSVRIVERPGPMGPLHAAAAARFAPDLGSVDVVHVHSLWRPYTSHTAAAGRRAGTPVVLTLHGMLMEHPMRTGNLKKRLYLRTLAARTFRNVSVVQLLNAEETRQSRLTGADFPFVELPNGVDASEFAELPEPGSFRSAQPALDGRTIILSMGRLHEMKGCDLLLGAFLDLARERDDIALVMAGPDEGSRPGLEAMLDGHPASDRVLLPGLVHGRTRLAMLADTDIFAQCSLHETASMSILEGAYAGKPLLLTDKCNYPDLISAGAGIQTPATREGVRTGLADLLAQRDRLAEMGRRARLTVEQRFLLSRITPRLVELYQRAIDGESFPRLQGPPSRG